MECSETNLVIETEALIYPKILCNDILLLLEIPDRDI